MIGHYPFIANDNGWLIRVWWSQARMTADGRWMFQDPNLQVTYQTHFCSVLKVKMCSQSSWSLQIPKMSSANEMVKMQGFIQSVNHAI